MSIGNKGLTDLHASIGTLTFPNLARSRSPTVPPPKHQLKASSGRARTDGHEAHQTDHKMTGETCETNRYFLQPLRLLSHVQKNLSSRWSLLDPSTSDPEMEMVVGTWLDRLRGEGIKTLHPHLNWSIPQAMNWMEEEIIDVLTELKSPTTAGGWGRLTGQTQTTLTGKGIAGHQTLTQGEEAQGHPKIRGYHGILASRRGILLISKMEIWNTKGLGQSSHPTRRVPPTESHPPRKTLLITQDLKEDQDKAKVQVLEGQTKVILWSVLGSLETSAWHSTGKTARYVITGLLT